eukprot:1052001-Pyramimonas_sp.AAC.2
MVCARAFVRAGISWSASTGGACEWRRRNCGRRSCRYLGGDSYVTPRVAHVVVYVDTSDLCYVTPDGRSGDVMRFARSARRRDRYGALRGRCRDGGVTEA